MQLLLGRTGFEDANIPAAGKTDWGMDTISRKLTGHISFLSDFIATLTQGQGYEFNGAIFYLQTWEPEERSPVSSVTLNYKGLINGTPPPDIQTSVALTTGSTWKDYATENDGVGRLYASDIIATISDTAPGPGSFGTTVEWRRNRYASGATMEFTYRALTTTYRYITLGPPKGPSFTKVLGIFDPTIERVRIVTSDGSIFGKNRIAQFGLDPVSIERVISFSSRQVYGTPYYECEDVVRRELTAPELI